MRPEFEELVSGWSASNIEDLRERIDRVTEFTLRCGQLSVKEAIVFNLMLRTEVVHDELRKQNG